MAPACDQRETKSFENFSLLQTKLFFAVWYWIKLSIFQMISRKTDQCVKTWPVVRFNLSFFASGRRHMRTPFMHEEDPTSRPSLDFFSFVEFSSLSNRVEKKGRHSFEFVWSDFALSPHFSSVLFYNRFQVPHVDKLHFAGNFLIVTRFVTSDLSGPKEGNSEAIVENVLPPK